MSFKSHKHYSEKNTNSELSSSSVVFINPKFKSAHINRNFLNKAPTPKVYVNPKFLNSTPTVSNALHKEVTSVSQINKIDSTIQCATVASSHNKSIPRTTTTLIKIGQRKLVRPSLPQLHRTRPPTVSPRKPLLSTYKIVKVHGQNNKKDLYKIDRRAVVLPAPATGKCPIIKNYSLNETLASTRVIITNYKLRRIGHTPQTKKTVNSVLIQTKENWRKQSLNKNLQLLNINGVFYKSTKSKLQMQGTTTPVLSAIKKSPQSQSKVLYVRGEKFVLDSGGKKLRRAVPNNTASSISHSSLPLLSRIDIGGLTYKAKSNNIFEQTDLHKTRVHLTSAKQRSINLLSRNLVKCNIPCPIFRKLGKCRALERGRCSKVHDVKHVAICSKYLRGSCTNDKCLMSHNVTLSKMPVCKFFLLGICVKTDCPYLHKKVNEKIEICQDFLKGFCEKAEKCSMRHEYLVVAKEKPDKIIQLTKKCYVTENTKKKIETTDKTLMDGNPSTSKNSSNSTETSRYFVDHESASTTLLVKNDDIEQVIPSRPKIGTLPSYIPIE